MELTSHNHLRELILHLPRLVRVYWLWFAISVIGSLGLFAKPGGYGKTAHSLLHGLCAQTPSHTFMFGDQQLPFDGRMTGIYAGCLVVIVRFVFLNGHLHYGNPPGRIVIMLWLLLGAMTVDGFNSLATDLGIWHAYAPGNAARLITGYGAGVALGMAIAWLLGSSLWKLSEPAPIAGSWRQLVVPVLLVMPFFALVSSGWEPLYPVLVLTLVMAAWVTVSILALVVVLLGLRLEDSISTCRALHVPVAISALLGLAIMISLAGARFWLEHRFGITNEMM